MVKLRLKRMGTKKKPFYRIIAVDSRAPRDGRAIDILGHYNPRKHPAIVEADEEKTLHWLRQGAVPTDTVRSLLRRQGILRRFHEERMGIEEEEIAEDLLEEIDQEPLFDVEPLIEEDSSDVAEDEVPEQA